jgi:gelsolin
MEFMVKLKSERHGKAVVTDVVDEDAAGVDDSHPFYAALTAECAPEGESTNVKAAKVVVELTPTLLRVSDSSGKIQCISVKTGKIRQTDLDSGDVFILDTTKMCFVWVGSGASHQEKQNGFGYAHSHLMSTANPLRPIVVIKEGHENKEFKMALAA